MKRFHSLLWVFLLVFSHLALPACKDSNPADEDGSRPRVAKVVFVTGDEEYRSEESMPMLAKILARDHGYETSVCYALSDEGEVDPNRSDHIDGLGELADADLMVLFTRFRRLPDEQLAAITAYVDSGRPLVGFRTATHAFRYPKESPHAARMNEDWPREVFGQKWISHHGHFDDGKEELTEVTLAKDAAEHPILRGIQPFKAASWLYHVAGGGDQLHGDCRPLLIGRALRSNHESRPERFPRTNPVAWTKSYSAVPGKPARVFFTTLGHPYDFKNENVRRLAIQGILWALGEEDRIPEEGCPVAFVDAYDPPNSGFGEVYRKGHFPRR